MCVCALCVWFCLFFCLHPGFNTSTQLNPPSSSIHSSHLTQPMSPNSPLIHFFHPTHLTSLAQLTHLQLTELIPPNSTQLDSTRLNSTRLAQLIQLTQFIHHSPLTYLSYLSYFSYLPHLASFTHHSLPHSLQHSLTRALRFLSLTPLSSFEDFTCEVLRSFHFLPTSQMRLSSSLLLAPPFLPCHLAMSCCVPVENQSVTLCDGFHAELTLNAQHSKPVAARLQVCKSVQEQDGGKPHLDHFVERFSDSVSNRCSIKASCCHGLKILVLTQTFLGSGQFHSF